MGVMIGCAIGSLIGGMVIGSGRRRTLIIFNAIIIVGTILTCILNFWTIFLGKILFGIAAATVQIAAPVMINETVPVY